tara:strand:- start:10398 stop:10619 length:222 start_codon:yes stop_codon:yes gene_type:complete
VKRATNKLKTGDLVRFNKKYRHLYADEALGIVMDPHDDWSTEVDKVYVMIWWFDLKEIHQEQINNIEVLSEAR